MWPHVCVCVCVCVCGPVALPQPSWIGDANVGW
jgi:hypothetical protein